MVGGRGKWGYFEMDSFNPIHIKFRLDFLKMVAGAS